MRLKKLATFTLLIFFSQPIMATQSIGHMGRLVDGSGAPLTGTADLQFDVNYSGDLTAGGRLCYLQIDDVPLVNGIYHTNLDFSSGIGSCDLNQVLRDVPLGQTVLMRVHETTLSLSFDWQNILNVPSALRSEYAAIAETIPDAIVTAAKIHPMGAGNDEVLTWNGAAWEPRAIPAGTSGTVTSVGAGDALTLSGTAADPVLNVGVDNSTIEIDTDALRVKDLGITTAKMAANAITPAKIDLNINQFDPIAPTLSLILDPSGAIGSGLSGLGVLTNSTYLEIDTNQLTLANSGVTAGTYTSVTVDAKGRITSAGSVSVADLPYIETFETACADGEIYVASTGLVSCQRHQDFVRIGSATNYVELRVPATHTGATSITLPSTSGTTNQILSSDGFGNLVWMDSTSAGTGGTVTSITAGGGLTGGTITTSGTIALGNVGTAGTYGSATQVPVMTTDAFGRVTGVVNTTISGVAPVGAAGGDLAGTYPNPTIATGAVTYAKTNFADGDIPQVKVSGLTTSLAAKEGAITPGTTAQYWRGDKSWQTLDTTAVPEGLNLYFLESRVRNTILDGYLIGADAAIAPTDTLMQAIAKLEAQIQADATSATSGTVTSITAGGGLTGGTITTSGTIALGNVGTAGTYGSATQVPVLTTDAYGRVTGVVNTTITGVTPGGAAGGDLAGTYPNPTIATGAVTYAKTNFLDGDIPQAKVSGLTTALAGKEGTIAAGLVTQYWSGDKTWQTLNTTAVPEGTRLYFTEDRARATALTGLNTTAGTVSATDSILSGIGKLVGNMGLINQSQWTTSGSNIYFNTGNVGIGTDNPSSPLHIRRPVGSAEALKLEGDSGVTGAPRLTFFDSNGVTSTGDISFTSSGFSFSNGSVGIGTTTPAAKLDIVGNIKISGGVPGVGKVLTSDAAGLASWAAVPSSADNLGNHTATQNLNLSTFRLVGNGGTEGVNISADGNVGVGTASPNLGIGGARGFVAKGTSNGVLRLEGGTSSVNIIGDQFGHLLISNNGSARTKFYANGNLGVGAWATSSAKIHQDSGNATPTYHKFTAGSSTGQTSSDGFDIGILGTGSAVIRQYENLPIDFYTNNTAQMRLDENGNLGIGNSSPTAKLEITGQIKMTGGTPGAGKVLTSDAAGLASWVALVNTDIVSALGFTPINKAGDTITSGTFDFGGTSTLRAATPIISSDVANKGYVDNLVATGSNQWTASGGNVYRSTGNVGIGTTTPSETLVVGDDLGDLTAGKGIVVGDAAGGGSVFVGKDSANWGRISFQNDRFAIQHNDSGVTSSIYMNEGNVGIGTTSPSSGKLQIEAVNSVGLFVGGTGFGSSYAMFKANETGGNHFSIQANTGGGGNEFLVLQPEAGKVGVGITTPQAPLHVESKEVLGGAPPSTTATPNGSLIIGNNGTNIISSMGVNANVSPQYFWIQPRNKSVATYFNTSLNPNGGNVGIGTTTPGSKLHINGGNVRVSAASETLVDIGYTTTSSFAFLRFNENGTNKNNFYSIGSTFADVTRQNNFEFDSVNGGIAHRTAGTYRMFITNAGNVGIGTTTPSQSLDVVGNIKASGSLITQGGASSYYGMGETEPSNTLSTNDLDYNRAAGNKIYRINSHTGLSLSAHTAYGGIRFYNQGYSAGNPNPYDSTIGSQMVMAINGGSVGIGTVNPSYKLHVNGSVAGVGAYTALSDIQYKKNVTPLDNAIEKLNQLTGYTYQWREDEFPEMDFNSNTQMGLIAQEVETVFPEAVSITEDGTRSVAYSMLIAPIIESIKTLSALMQNALSSNNENSREIASLKEENVELRRQNQMIIERLNKLEAAQSE